MMKEQLNQVKSFWKVSDRQQKKLLNIIEEQEEELSDEIQSILDSFREIELKGYLSKSETERLHRSIRKWEREGYDEREMRLWMNDLKSRKKVRGEEALFLFIFAAMLGSYHSIMNDDIDFLVICSKSAYKRAFKEAHKVTRKGSANIPNREFVKKALESTLPNGGNYYNDLAADAQYRARQIQKQMISNIVQDKPLSMSSPEFKKIMNSQRQWQLRRTLKTKDGGFAGYYDMIMSYIVQTSVAQAYMDAQVKKYRYIAVMDSVTTETCQSLDGKVFLMSEMKIGINFPPTYPPPHPCRSMTEPIE